VGAQLIRIEATLCGRFYPVFKEARPGSEGVFEGIASRAGESCTPHTMVRHGHEGIQGAPRPVDGTREGGGAPAMSHGGEPDGGTRAHGCRGWGTPCGTERVRTTSWRSTGIHKVPGGGPHPHDDVHRGATDRTAGRAQWRGLGRRRLARAGVPRHDQEADGRERDGAAGMDKTAVADVHEALGHDVLEESAEKLQDVELGGTWAGTADFPGGEGDRVVCERDDAAGGDGDLADRGGERGEGGVAVVVGLTVDIPRDGPDLGIDVLQQASLGYLFLEDGAGDGRAGFDGHKDVGTGGQPGGAVRGEATARDDGVDMRVGLELSTPGMQDPGTPREVGPNEACVGGQPREGRSRRGKHGVVREALLRADKETQGLRDGEGAEEVRPRPLCVEVVLEPLRGCRLLTLGTVAVPTGMGDTVLPPTGVAWIQAVTILATAAVLDGADDLAVGRGEVRIPLQIFWRTRCEDVAESDQDRRPCMRVFRRS